MRTIGIILSLLLLISSFSAQSYQPVAQFESLMNMRFYEANGGFLVEDIQLVFPPASAVKASLVVTCMGRF